VLNSSEASKVVVGVLEPGLCNSQSERRAGIVDGPDRGPRFVEDRTGLLDSTGVTKLWKRQAR